MGANQTDEHTTKQRAITPLLTDAGFPAAPLKKTRRKLGK